MGYNNSNYGVNNGGYQRQGNSNYGNNGGGYQKSNYSAPPQKQINPSDDFDLMLDLLEMLKEKAETKGFDTSDLKPQPTWVTTEVLNMKKAGQ